MRPWIYQAWVTGHREHYSPELFADEVMAVAKHAGFGTDTIVVGHSFGGCHYSDCTSLWP